ncbi:hypothetical protein PV396_18155 [Streptomyces sp. ME02-8801-2C]|uniref:hypothetical protein n=1 Tax=Streptomyces sp. ME02-8801-2C TaxID=3028680 RepID=UPI0029A802BC|nr:hypothetical protein [Streptomyces sp. ME02-8801-2C]MDX3453845.1 hypothetical protein [Streptomyces sp. ME02-8801-2C]
MTPLAITWTLHSHGWAFIKVSDDQGEAEVIASYVTDGPEQFLYAIARLVLGDEDTRAAFEGEPQVYQWFFHRDGSDVDIRLVRLDHDLSPSSSATVLWSARHTVTALARSAVRAFDRIAHEVGQEAYETQWGQPFPRPELEALRTAMRDHSRMDLAEAQRVAVVFFASRMEDAHLWDMRAPSEPAATQLAEGSVLVFEFRPPQGHAWQSSWPPLRVSVDPHTGRPDMLR